MSQIINWNFVPGGFNPTYSWQPTSTTVNTPMWTSAVTGGTDMFHTAQGGTRQTVKSAEDLYSAMQSKLSNLDAAQRKYNEVFAQKQKIEAEIAQIRDIMNKERFVDPSKYQADLSKAEQELQSLTKELSNRQGAVTKARNSYNQAANAYNSARPAVQQAVTQATPAIESSVVPAERALVPFRAAQSQTVPPVQPHVENATTQALVPLKPAQTKAVGFVKPTIAETAPAQELVQLNQASASANINPAAFEDAVIIEDIAAGTQNTGRVLQLNPTPVASNVVPIEQGLAETPAAASVSKERGFFGRLFDRIFGSRADKIANAKERISSARKDANEAYKSMKDSRQTLLDAKDKFANLDEVGASPKGIPAKRIAKIEEGLANGKFTIEDFKTSEPEIYTYFKNKDNYAKCLADVKNSGLEYAQKNGEYIDKLNNVKKAQKKLSWFQRGTDARELTEGAIGRTEKRISRATDKASTLLEGADKSTIKEALGKKGLSKGGKIAIAGGALVLLGLGIAALCGAFKKKDNDEQQVQEPTNQTNPAEPATPEEPTVPAVPEEPTEPTVPVAPVEPTEPTVPTEPTEPTTPSDRFDYNPGSDFTVVKGDSLWDIVKGIYNKKDPNFSSLPQKEQDRKIIYGIRKMVAENGLTYKAKDEKNPHYYVPIYPGQVIKQVELD